MSGRRERYLEAIGIPVWRRRGAGDDGGDAAAVETAPASAPGPAAVVEPGGDDGPRVTDSNVSDASAVARGDVDVAGLGWEALERTVSECTLCPLHESRTQTVFGVGNREADLLVVGEAPGADEDRQGEPFVGRAGRLLNAMLRAIGYERADVYIANILKCRPPNNRDPQAFETSSCTPYLERQMALMEPKAVLAVGRVSAQWLLQSDRPIGTLRGRVYGYGTRQVPLVVTYHPAYLLRSPEAKAKAWADLCLVKSTIDASR